MIGSELPLAGVRVLDLSRILAGPVCTQLLADLGADVVKLERPGTGDDTRQWGPPFLPEGGASAYFLACNRGKRSLALDLSHNLSQPVLDELLRRADVLVENFLPEALQKFGLTPERLRQINPRLVSCSISAFGRTGPLAEKPGYDLMIQATSGMMAITGEPAGAPMKVGVAISDVVTGLYAATSVLAALIGRQRTSQGQAIDLALADCTLASLVNVAQGTLLTGQRPRRLGNAHPQIVPYEVFATRDGHLVLAIGADRQWRRFCHAVGRDDWTVEPRFATNPARVEHRDALVPLVRSLIETRTTADWLSLLSSIDLPHSAVLALDEALATPQTQARGMVQTVVDSRGRHFRLLGSAVHWFDATLPMPRVPPQLGEHTEEILRDWLTLDDPEIAALRASGAIA